MAIDRFAMYKVDGGYKMVVGRTDNDVDVYDFKSQDDEVSDYPNVARLEGTINKSSDSSWLNYWKGFMASGISVYDKGNVEIIDNNDDVMKIKMVGDKFTGMWSLVNGDGSNRLFWKNPKDAEGVDCACVKGDCETSGESINDKFTSVSQVLISDDFSGTGMAAGVYKGHAGKNTLFTNEFISKMVDKYKDRPGDIKVDWNHDSKYTGKLSEVKLEKEPVYRFVVKGKAGDVVPKDSALSIEYKAELSWDDKFKVYKVVDADIKAVTVAPGMTPGCKMCYVE